MVFLQSTGLSAYNRHSVKRLVRLDTLSLPFSRKPCPGFEAAPPSLLVVTQCPEPPFSHCKMHALANASHHCLKLGRHALSTTECSKAKPASVSPGRSSAALHQSLRPAPIQPSPPQPASTYFFSPSKSKNDSKAGGAFILAPRSRSQTPLAAAFHPQSPEARPLPGHSAAANQSKHQAPPPAGRMTLRRRKQGRGPRAVRMRQSRSPVCGFHNECVGACSSAGRATCNWLPGTD